MMIPLILTLLILLTVYIRTSPLKNTLACNLDTSLPGNMMEQEESLPMVELSDTGEVGATLLRHKISQQLLLVLLLSCENSILLKHV